MTEKQPPVSGGGSAVGRVRVQLLCGLNATPSLRSRAFSKAEQSAVLVIVTSATADARQAGTSDDDLITLSSAQLFLLASLLRNRACP